MMYCEVHPKALLLVSNVKCVILSQGHGSKIVLSGVHLRRFRGWEDHSCQQDRWTNQERLSARQRSKDTGKTQIGSSQRRIWAKTVAAVASNQCFNIVLVQLMHYYM